MNYSRGVEVTLLPGARLTVGQRLTIERSFRIGLAQGQIAAIIGKDESTVSRELVTGKATFCWAVPARAR